jgi:protein-tyrosine phosphatase
MNRIDVHCHFLPGLDDGCVNPAESLECLRVMVAAGYSRIFCTPHCGTAMFADPTTADVAKRVEALDALARSEKIPIELRPGGELRLNPHLAEALPKLGCPTFGHSGKYVLADHWEDTWPTWTNRAIEWLQNRGYTVIIAHPERMPALLSGQTTLEEIARLGVLFQGNLGPIGGNDHPSIVALAQRFLMEDRYFMVGTDGHHTSHLSARLQGLEKIEQLAGTKKLDELTIHNPSRLWT